MAGQVCPKGAVSRIIEKRAKLASFQRAALRSNFRTIGGISFRSSMRLSWEELASSLENGSKAQDNEPPPLALNVYLSIIYQ